MLGHVITPAQSEGSPHSWASRVRLFWMLCVPVAAWLLGREGPLYTEGDGSSAGTGTGPLALVQGILLVAP
jgi:hypothetical protein